MIQWVYEGVCGVKKLDAVYIATDDERIVDCVRGFGGVAIMTSPKHESGSDRLAECVDILKLDRDDIVLNIQGDEPLINSTIVEELLLTMKDKLEVIFCISAKALEQNKRRADFGITYDADLPDPDPSYY